MIEVAASKVIEQIAEGAAENSMAKIADNWIKDLEKSPALEDKGATSTVEKSTDMAEKDASIEKTEKERADDFLCSLEEPESESSHMDVSAEADLDGTEEHNNKSMELPEEGMGGSYYNVKENVQEAGLTDVEVHHMPADSVSPLERNDGPAIAMEKDDHRLTASCGNSREAQEYRSAQAAKIEQGDFKGAMQMDIDDIRSKFGNKYDKQIKQAEAYRDKLQEMGRI